MQVCQARWRLAAPTSPGLQSIDGSLPSSHIVSAPLRGDLSNAAIDDTMHIHPVITTSCMLALAHGPDITTLPQTIARPTEWTLHRVRSTFVGHDERESITTTTRRTFKAERMTRPGRARQIDNTTRSGDIHETTPTLRPCTDAQSYIP